MGNFNVNVRDYSNEKSKVTLNIPDLTAGNITQMLSDANDLSAGIEGVSLGVIATSRLSMDFAADDPAIPTDSEAQRELAWLVIYADYVADRKYQVSIPCPDVLDTALWVQGTGMANLSASDWVAFIAAFEALAVSQDGNAVQVESARLTGRNL